jgi:CheY-like chemotaxis protein
MKILIVDDKKEGRYLLETMLKGNGFDVVDTTNGAEALEKLRANGFDMIVSDILMPVMDGFALCRECKGDEKLKDIPFVFYTATYTDEGDEEFALKLGAHKFIRKPTDPEEFIKIIQGVIRDAEEGKIERKMPVLEEEKEVFKLYSERLVKKLEKKMLDLEKEITERKKAEEELEKHREHLEEMVQKRTAELQSIVNSMAGREVRMAELKETIKKLRAQLESAGLTPVADDPLKKA